MRQVTIGRLGAILVFIHHTDWVFDPEKKSCISLWVLCFVYLVFSSRPGCTERTVSHPQSGSGASYK